MDRRLALVTGASAGIGAAFARILASHGYDVALTARRAERLESLAEEISLRYGVEALSVAADLADPEAPGQILDFLTAHGRTVDALVNNAALYGALRGGRFDAIQEADWDATMAVNVKGIWNCCKAVVPAMKQGGGGSIVNIASLAATYGMPYALHYTTSKAAVIGMTRGLARELGRDNIRVNAVAPSAVMTEGTREFMGEKHDKALDVIRAGQSIQRTLVPSDLSGTIAWLLGDGSGFVTGQTINVDGGQFLRP